jgi:exosortase
MTAATIYSTKTMTKFFVLTALVAVLFARPLGELLTVWRIDADYSHGFFVIPLSLYMVWRKKDAWKNVENRPSWTGFVVFVFTLIIYLGALQTRFHTLIYATIIILIASLCVSFFGWRKSSFFLPAILFLIFMFPVPSSVYIMITNPLKLLITGISATIIRLFDIPVLQQGNLLYFANTRLEVAEACSGIRSIYSYLMLGIVFSIFCHKMLSKVILAFSAIPLAIFVNIIRVTMTGILAHYFGEKAAQGFFHEFAGMVVFVAGLVLMFGTYYLVEGRFPKACRI